MKKLLLLMGLLFANALTASAGPVAPCGSGTLTSFIALGATGCTVGGAQFSNFTVLSGQSFATPISPDAITVNVIDGASGPSLVFLLNVTAGPGDLLEAIFGYQVTGASLVGNALSMSGPTVTGDGAITAVEDKCLNGTFASDVTGCSGTPATLIVFSVDGDSFLSDQLTFPGVPLISVVTDITIDGGLSGTATLNGSVTNEFTTGSGPQPVPEPTSLLLLGSGIYVLNYLRRRQG